MPARNTTGIITPNEQADLMSQAMAGDIQFSITPATTTRAATLVDFTRDVEIKLTNAAGVVHSWFNKAVTTGVSIGSVTVGDGVASIASTTLTIVNGIARVTVSGTGAWAADDTNTLTVANLTVMGYTVTGGTSVETITA
jgi:hypothetical protein